MTLFQEHHSAHGMRIAPLCNGAFRFIIAYFCAMKDNNSLVAALLLCYTFKIRLFSFYIKYLYINVFACFLSVLYNTKSKIYS